MFIDNLIIIGLHLDCCCSTTDEHCNLFLLKVSDGFFTVPDHYWGIIVIFLNLREYY